MVKYAYSQQWRNFRAVCEVIIGARSCLCVERGGGISLSEVLVCISLHGVNGWEFNPFIKVGRAFFSIFDGDHQVMSDFCDDGIHLAQGRRKALFAAILALNAW